MVFNCLPSLTHISPNKMVAQMVNKPPAMRETGFGPWVGKIPGEGNGYPFQYPGLENSMDCIVHGVAKSRTRLRDSRFLFQWRKEAGSVP